MLRFKNDDGSEFPEWEEHEIAELIQLYNEKVSSDCQLPILTSSKKNGIEYQEEHFTGKQRHDIEGYNVLPRNYCTYRNRSDGTDFTFNINKLCDKGIVSKFYPVFKEKDCDLFFLVSLLNNERKTVRKIAYTAKGTGQKVLSITDLRNITVNMPSLPEQQKIADFLSTIDIVIAKQKETVSAWEERKKGVMQKLFSQEVRFKADDGSEFPEWEEKSYLSICNVFADGDWIESKDQSDSGIRLIQTGNIGNGVFIDKDDKKKYISKETFDRLKCNEVFEGDILISRLPSPAGRACIVPKLNERMITAVDCTIVRTDKSIILHDYCVQFMQSSKHFYYVASMMAGGTRQRISRKNLEDELISVPCLAEQQKIADCLSSLDEVIEKQKATLAAWEELKKGLLQQMFV